MKNRLWSRPTYFEALWHRSPDGMAVTDAAGIVLAANPAYCALHGFLADELVGQSLSITFSEPTRRTAMAHYHAVFESRNTARTYPAAIQWRNTAGRRMESRIAFISRANREAAMLSSVRILPDGATGSEQSTPEILVAAIEKWGLGLVSGSHSKTVDSPGTDRRTDRLDHWEDDGGAA